LRLGQGRSSVGRTPRVLPGWNKPGRFRREQTGRRLRKPVVGPKLVRQASV
jgi:hypothetical protein